MVWCSCLGTGRDLPLEMTMRQRPAQERGGPKGRGLWLTSQESFGGRYSGDEGSPVHSESCVTPIIYVEPSDNKLCLIQICLFCYLKYYYVFFPFE